MDGPQGEYMIQELMGTGAGYPGLWLVCAGSGLFLPMPEDVPLMYAGTRIAANTLGWPGTLVVAWLGVVTRDLSAWAAGRYLFGWMIRTGWFEWMVNQRRIDRAERLISKHGASAVLMGRFMIGFRVPFFVAAGAMGVPLRAFAAYDALGLLFAVPLAVGLGFLFGEPIAELTAFILNRSGTIVAMVAVVLIGWMAVRKAHRGLSTAKSLYTDRTGTPDVEDDA